MFCQFSQLLKRCSYICFVNCNFILTLSTIITQRRAPSLTELPCSAYNNFSFGLVAALTYFAADFM